MTDDNAKELEVPMNILNEALENKRSDAVNRLLEFEQIDVNVRSGR